MDALVGKYLTIRGVKMSVGGDFSHGCDTCAKACVDCKTNVVSLEKKNFKMAIALTSALTLLGEQGVKAVFEVVKSISGITEKEEAEQQAVSSAGDGYRFGRDAGRMPAFSGYRPPWNPATDGSGDGGVVMAGESWGRAGGSSPLLSSYAVPTMPVSVNFWSHPSAGIAAADVSGINALDMLSPSEIPMVTDGADAIPATDYAVETSGGGGIPMPIPSPGSICVLAVGRAFGSRARI